MINSEGNIVTLIDEGAFGSEKYHFNVFSPNGDLISWKSYLLVPPLCPMAFYETHYGYKALAAQLVSGSKIITSLPMFINMTKTGDSINFIYPYGNAYDSLNSAKGTKFMLVQVNKNTIFHNGLFYNAFIKDNIVIDSITSIANPHLICQAYDTNGNVRWRLGIDTITTSGQYNFFDMKLSADGSLILLTIIAPSISDLSSAKIQIIKVDETGVILKKIEYPIINRLITPRGIVELNNGDFVVLVKDIVTSEQMLIRIGDNGKKIGEKGNLVMSYNFPRINDRLDLWVLKMTPEGNLLTFGNTFLKKEDALYKKMIIIHLSDDFEIKSSLEWYETRQDKGGSTLHDVIFINKTDFIGIGNKDISKFYIARFSLDPTLSVNELSTNNALFRITPNPVADFLLIKPLNGSNYLNTSEIKIFSLMGIQVFTTRQYKHAHSTLLDGDGVKIDVSGLSPGLYFVKVGDKIEKFIKI